MLAPLLTTIARNAEERENANGREWRVTFSAGIAEWDRRASAEELIRWADGGLYAAKHAGKNRTVRHSQMVSGSTAATNPS